MMLMIEKYEEIGCRVFEIEEKDVNSVYNRMSQGTSMRVCTCVYVDVCLCQFGCLHLK